MAFDLDYFAEPGAPACALDEDEIARICDFVLVSEGVERPCMASVTIASDERMAELNAELRGHEAPTDVISVECERPDDPDLAPGEPCELGDIVLAPEFIAAQAAGFGTTPADETRIMVVHAMLHLLGYDHNDEDEALLMEEREDAILAAIPTDGDLARVAIVRHGQEGNA